MCQQPMSIISMVAWGYARVLTGFTMKFCLILLSKTRNLQKKRFTRDVRDWGNFENLSDFSGNFLTD